MHIPKEPLIVTHGRPISGMLVSITAGLVASCGTKSVEGTYNVVNAPVPGVLATFGKGSFSFSSGASGNYEINGDTVILTGPSISGIYRIEGDKLVGDRFTFVPRDPGDKSAINHGPHG